MVGSAEGTLLELHDAAAARGTRGRIVMLVDNAVEGDSRVQKTARSVAEAGWDVTLLGRSLNEQETMWRLGRAQVVLLTVRSASRSDGPTTGVAGRGRAQMRQRMRRWRANLRDRGGLPLAMARQLRRPWDSARTWFWRARLGERAWRRLEPGLWDFERAYGPVIDDLAPDLIHAHDFRMLGVGARAAVRGRDAGRPVRLVWDAHEFLPGVKPWWNNARWLPAHRGYEREYAPYADAVVTVSDDLADLLRKEHTLAERPTVVLNAPAVGHDPAPDEPPMDVRALCGIGPETPLLVYSGLAAAHRGLAIMVEGLPRLPEAHIALVVNNPDAPYVRRLEARAARLAVGDRVHVLPYVSHWRVVPFLSTADVGVIPIHHWPNHEIALITKFFEYSHAHLPVIVSDVRTMADTVRATGQGEVFRAQDAADYVRAVRAVLIDPRRYRAAYDQPGLLAGWTWEAQAVILDRLYARVLGAARRTEGVTA